MYHMIEIIDTVEEINKNVSRTLVGTVVVAALVVVASGALAYDYDKTHPKPAARYATEFTDKGKCLHDTPYDPSNGAQSLTRPFDEADSLTIIPDFANSPIPPVLYLSVEGDQIRPRDHQTESILVKSGCINATKA